MTRRQRSFIYFTVIVAGMSTLAVEFTAGRMLQTVYGTSNIVWANVIGLVLLALTMGYFIGGRMADNHPQARLFYGLVVAAGFSSVLVLLLTSLILRQAAAALAAIDIGATIGSLLLVVVMLVLPVTLLGCLSPFAIRLALDDVGQAGRVSGRVYALSTLGSLAGTYLPVLVTIPLAGSRATAVLFGGALVVVGMVGFLSHTEPKSRGRSIILFFSLATILILGSTFLLSGSLKDASGQLYETESAYNYIQVIREGDCNYLLLNEGQAYHSFYCDGGRVPEVSVWSIMLAAPYFIADAASPANLAVIGLAAGTIPTQFTRVFGAIPVDGIELDPAVAEVGRDFFALDEPNINVIIGDGRYELNRLSGPYDVITLDAYKVPYIPWHMTTQEFMSEMAERLSTDGVLAINVGRGPNDRRLVEAIAATAGTVFPSVHAIDVPHTLNTILVATRSQTSADNLRYNAASISEHSDKLLKEALQTAAANITPVAGDGPVLTDDRAPSELISDSIVLKFLLGSGPAGLDSLNNE